MAALIGWLVAMTSRQVGHLFFEPRGYDQVNQATDEYKEEIKVGYNIKRKLVLLAVWAASPLLLVADPTLLGMFTPHADTGRVGHAMSASSGWWSAWPASPSARVQLFVLKDIQTGLVWATKIATDPFHDIKLYHRAPLELLRRRAAVPSRSSRRSSPSSATRSPAKSPSRSQSGRLRVRASCSVRASGRSCARRTLPAAGACKQAGVGQHLAQDAPLDRRWSVASAPVSNQPSRRIASAAARKRSATASKSASVKFRLNTSRPVPIQLSARPAALR